MSTEATSKGVLPYVKSSFAYLLGLIIIMNGIGILAVHSVGSGALLLCGGIFLFPASRRIIESKLETELTLPVTAGIFLLFFFGSSALLMMAVDVPKEGPEMLAPYF
jgi:hypothetical protein